MAAGATAFTVYNKMFMPLSYGDLIAEYDRLIKGVALWDVAGERQVQLLGPDAGRLAQRLSARDLSGMQIGQGKYVAMCDHDGRLLNDPILMKLDEARYWFSLADADMLLWCTAVANEGDFDVEVSEPDVSPLAVQGPRAVALAADLFGEWIHDLKYFWFRETELNGIPLVLCRSGWSKQGGFELFCRMEPAGANSMRESVPQAPNMELARGLRTMSSGWRAGCCPSVVTPPPTPTRSKPAWHAMSTLRPMRTTSGRLHCSGSSPTVQSVSSRA